MQILIIKASNYEHFLFDFCVSVKTKVLVNLAVVFPDLLVLDWNKGCVQSINFDILEILEKLFNLLVLLVESRNLASWCVRPAIFNGLFAKYN
jgi:hypothetical protein